MPLISFQHANWAWNLKAGVLFSNPSDEQAALSLIKETCIPALLIILTQRPNHSGHCGEKLRIMLMIKTHSHRAYYCLLLLCNFPNYRFSFFFLRMTVQWLIFIFFSFKSYVNTQFNTSIWSAWFEILMVGAATVNLYLPKIHFWNTPLVALFFPVFQWQKVVNTQTNKKWQLEKDIPRH